MAGQVIVELTAKDKVTPVLNKVAASAEKLNQKLAPMPTAFQKIGAASKNAFTGLNQKLNSISGALSRVGTAFVVKGFVTAGIEADRTAKRLKLLGDEYGETAALQKLAAEGAKKFTIGQTQAATAVSDLFGRLRPAGVALKDIETVFNGVGVAAAKMNLSASDVDAVMLQLSQALGAGVLNGENLVSVMERLPSIGNAIAKSMGKSVGELKELGAKGKLTTDVVIKGLKELSKQKPPKADAYKQFNKAMADLSTTMGTELLPAITPIVQATAGLISAFGKLPGPVKTLVAAVVGLGAAFVVLAPAVAAIGPAVAAIGPILSGLLPILAGVFTGPVGWISLLVAAGAAIYAFRDQIGDALSGVGRFFQNALASIGLMKPAFNEAAEEAKKINTAAGELAPKIDAAAEAKKRHIEALKQSLELSTQEKTQVQAQQAAYQNTVNVTNARLNAEQSINDLQGQILERAYEQAGSATQRLNIAKQIFQNEINGAKIAHQQAMNSIEAEKVRLAFKKQGAIVDLQILAARGEIAKMEADEGEAKVKAQAALDKALATQRSAIHLIDGQIKSQDQIAVHQKKAADAQLQAKILTARQNLEQKLVSKEIGKSDQEAVKLSGQLANSNTSARNLATGTGQVATNAQRSAGNFIRVATNADRAAISIQNAANAQARLNALRAQGGGGGGGGGGGPTGAAAGAYWAGGFQAFAKGGVVKKPTLGLIGEGGEDEYIIPQSKAAGFAANFLSGQRGAGAIPGFAEGGFVSPSVSIQTGPVTQMDGQNYVTAQDMSQAVQAGVEQTLQFIMSDGTIRNGIGLS